MPTKTNKKPRRRNRWIRSAEKKGKTDKVVYMTCDESNFKLEAADGEENQGDELKRFTMTAYTGGMMFVNAFYHPVVVDLEGLKINSQSVPIFMQHDPGRIVGHSTKITATKTTLKLGGLISGVGEDAEAVKKLAANGFPWQASIGAPVNRIERVEAGEKIRVNGMMFQGPLIVARASTLKEVSFVPIGADGNTTAQVAATSSKGNRNMNPEFRDWLEAQDFDPDSLSDKQIAALTASWEAGNSSDNDPPAKPKAKVEAGDGGQPKTVQAAFDVEADRKSRADEAERCNRIREICAEHNNPTIEHKGESVTLEACAIREGWDLEKVELKAENFSIRQSRSNGPAIHVNAGGPPSAAVIEAAVCKTAKLGTLEASFDEKTLEASDKHFKKGIGLQQVLLEAAALRGYPARYDSIRSDLRGVIRAAFSSAEISNILSNTANKFMAEMFMHVEQAWRMIAKIRPANDFKQMTIVRMLGESTFEEVGNTGELKHGTLGDATYTNQVKTYGLLLGISRTHIINDDLGALTEASRRIGRGGALTLNTRFWTEFLDNAGFFKTANSNYFEGASSNLQSSSLKTAVEKFRKQTDDEDKPLGVMPKLLLVPPEEEVTADELYVSTNNNTGGAATKEKVPNRNVFAGKYEPVVSAYLSSSGIANSSTTAWYLLADPMDVPTMEVAFLNGQETPILEEADADFDRLGIQLRGYFDFGCAKQEYRGGVKSKGAS